MGEPGFWDDQDKAQALVGELKALKALVDPWEQLHTSAENALELYELAEMESDDDTLKEVVAEAESLLLAWSDYETLTLLTDPNDKRNCFLHITPGQGGTESCDWAEMVMRMITRFSDAQDGWEVVLQDLQRGEEAGIKSATLYVKGPNAFGFLKSERGVHRLVRISPYDSAKRRHTSFVSVDVTPEYDDVEEVEINDKDLRVDTYRAGGAGGQHVNKTDSAVRITHVPTGIVVQCQNERSQIQNRAVAMKMLGAKLQQKAEEERRAQEASQSGDKMEIGFGSQIRNYVLQPYTMCKDLRSRKSIGDVQRVLDGDLMPLIDSYLRWLRYGQLESDSEAPDEED